jgi:hypothetical protein
VEEVDAQDEVPEGTEILENKGQEVTKQAAKLSAADMAAKIRREERSKTLLWSASSSEDDDDDLLPAESGVSPST